MFAIQPSPTHAAVARPMMPTEVRAIAVSIRLLTTWVPGSPRSWP